MVAGLCHFVYLSLLLILLVYLSLLKIALIANRVFSKTCPEVFIQVLWSRCSKTHINLLWWPVCAILSFRLLFLSVRALLCKVELITDHLCSLVIPVVITHCTPGAIMIDLYPTLSVSVTINKANWNYRGKICNVQQLLLDTVENHVI